LKNNQPVLLGRIKQLKTKREKKNIYIVYLNLSAYKKRFEIEDFC